MEKSAPFFSVVVVCRDAGEKLHSTVESILSQTESDFEIVVKDAMSSDGSVEALPDDARIRVIREKDAGIYDGMNAALRHAKGRFILFLNCGDLFASDGGLAETKAYILEAERNDRSVIKSDGEENGSAVPAVYYGDVRERLTGARAAANPVMDDFALYRNIPCHQACFYGAALFAERGFDTRYRVRADYEHFLWCYYVKHAAMRYMGFTVADYEGGGFSESPEGRKLSAAEHREITGRYTPPGKRLLYRAYMIATLQPLREKIARSPRTAALYSRLKDRAYAEKI